MKPRYPETKRKRIILIYSLAIVLPGILMGIMAYQGILNDQARREQENRKQLIGTAQNFFFSIDSLMVADLNGIESICNSAVPLPDYLRLAFIQDEKPDLNLLHHQLLFVPDSIESNIADTEADEVLKDIAIARSLRIERKYQEAMDSWQSIGKKNSGYLISNKIPLGLVAQLEMIRILVRLNNDDEIFSALKQMYLSLLNPALSYEASQFRFFMNEIDNLNIKLSPELNVLREKVIRMAEESEFLIKMISEREPFFLVNNQDAAWPGIYKYLIDKDSIQSLYLSIEQANNKRLACLIDVFPFVRQKSGFIMTMLDPEERLLWEISDSIRSEYTSFPFPEYYPGLVLNINNKQARLLSSSIRGKSLYIMVFIFIAGLMILGLAFTIYALNQELKLNRLKSDFISNVSHELKSPLTSMRHLTDLLYQDRVKNEDQKKKYYSTMLEQSEHLSYLIDNILDFSRLEDHRKKFSFQKLDYEALLSYWVTGFSQRLNEAGIELIQDIQENITKVEIDQDAIQQVINNLLDNAIKYSGTGKKIVITVRISGKYLSTSIRDWGLGIAKKDHDKIFERFYRSAESLEMGVRGSGIGLTIVKRIIEAHGGTISLKSKPGEGSIFIVLLPIKQNQND